MTSLVINKINHHYCKKCNTLADYCVVLTADYEEVIYSCNKCLEYYFKAFQENKKISIL